MRRLTAVSAAAVAVAGLASPALADEAYRAEVQKWREDREARLKADGGWLTLAGLFWLKEGPNRFGTDPAGDIVLPEGSAPAKTGVFELTGEQVTVALQPGASGRIGGKAVSGATPMRPDTSGSPDVLEMGTLTMSVIKRGDRYGIRLKDKNSPVRKGFTGLRWFDIQEEYRVEARWVSYPQPKPVKVPNVLGQTESMPSPGYAEFTLGGKPVRVDGVLEDPNAEQLFFILRDQTSGKETYGAGRFLYADLPKAGKVVLDFNKAYSPPCAFTPYATCPLPPPQNWMPVRVEAGEMAYGKGH
ncbi:MAG TPA: DUF1684 domain-containing protein [Vicinamibacteria bacterium]|nr:DUF1684 domain-containing protein [Vicinamibacteria bacterium]